MSSENQFPECLYSDAGPETRATPDQPTPRGDLRERVREIQAKHVEEHLAVYGDTNLDAVDKAAEDAILALISPTEGEPQPSLPVCDECLPWAREVKVCIGCGPHNNINWPAPLLTEEERMDLLEFLANSAWGIKKNAAAERGEALVRSRLLQGGEGSWATAEK